MLGNSQILDFVTLHLLPQTVRGILLVGSRARGYAVGQSDVDIMVFYDADDKFVSHSTHDIALADTDFTIEHHDLAQFFDEVLDHRYNIGSLRMLLKVRDSLVLQGGDELNGLLRVAMSAHLDMGVLLDTLAHLVANWHQLTDASVPYRRQLLLRWTEFISSMDLLCQVGREAYSKPKWLYRTLTKNRATHVIELLDSIYCNTPDRIEAAYRATEAIVDHFDLSRLPLKDNYLFFKVTIADVRAMKDHHPAEIGPVIRFLATSYYQFFCGPDPLEHVRLGTAFPATGFEAVFESNTPAEYNDEQSFELFKSYIRRLSLSVISHFAQRAASDIGSLTFVPYFLASFGATDLMPGIYKRLEILPNAPQEDITKQLQQVQAWLDGTSLR